MKHLLLLSIGTLFFLSSFAQSNKEDIDMIQAIYGKEKKAIFADFIMPPNEAKKKAFWDLYDKYETERKALGKKRIDMLEKYADNYLTLDDKSTDALIKSMETQGKAMEGLISTYYEKIKLAVGTKQAAQFYQLEGYLLSVTRVYILGNIPFIGELEKSEKMPAAK
jgi:hypothetical protein